MTERATSQNKVVEIGFYVEQRNPTLGRAYKANTPLKDSKNSKEKMDPATTNEFQISVLRGITFLSKTIP